MLDEFGVCGYVGVLEGIDELDGSVSAQGQYDDDGCWLDQLRWPYRGTLEGRFFPNWTTMLLTLVRVNVLGLKDGIDVKALYVLG